MPPTTIKIDVTKIDKQYLYKGKSGTYLDLVVFENRDGPGKYGDTHYLVQSVPKEERAKGVKGNIVGNMRVPERLQNEPSDGPVPKQEGEGAGDDVPF